MHDIEVLNEFKKQLLLFLDELITQFPLEGDLVVFRLFIANQVYIKDVLDTITLKINKDNGKLRKMAKERNEKFFLNENIFDIEDNVDKNKINHFKKLWLSNDLDDEDKNIIWQWMETFIYFSDKYSKK
jgi:hypothetical protein